MLSTDNPALWSATVPAKAAMIGKLTENPDVKAGERSEKLESANDWNCEP